MKEVKILDYLIRLESEMYQVYLIDESVISGKYTMESFKTLHEAIEYVNTFIK